jgi:hypothetical protein
MRAAGPLAGLASGALAMLLAGCAPAVWDFGDSSDAGPVDATGPDASMPILDSSLPSDVSDAQNKPGDASFHPDAQTICNNFQSNVCCNNNSDCNGNPNGYTRCEQTTHQCVDCIDGNDCNSQTCIGFQCLKRCDVDGSNQCGRSFCGGNGLCLQCITGDDCAGMTRNVFCNTVNYRCVECVSPLDCNPGESCSLMGQCFFTNSNGGGSTNHDP